MSPIYLLNFQLPRAKREIHQRLISARRWMDDHYYRPLRLNEIARQACLSRYHFLRLFKRTFNKTPHQYLMQRRIQKAKELLIAGQHSVTSACFDVGFESLGSFSYLFRRQVGRPPVFYRIGLHPVSTKRLPQAPVPACFLAMYGRKPPKSA